MTFLSYWRYKELQLSNRNVKQQASIFFFFSGQGQIPVRILQTSHVLLPLVAVCIIYLLVELA